MRKTIFLGLSLILVAGCAGPEGRVKSALFDHSPRQPSQNLDVIQTGQQPTRPHKVIALLTADGDADDEAECVEGMVLRAKRLGADGLIILEPEAPNKSIVFKYGLIGPSPDKRVFRGNAFVYQQ